MAQCLRRRVLRGGTRGGMARKSIAALLLALVPVCRGAGYICYMYSASEQPIQESCLSHPGFVFTGGANSANFTECGTCTCCQPSDTPAAYPDCLAYARSRPFTDQILQPRPLPDPKVPLVAHRWLNQQPVSQEFFDGGFEERLTHGFMRYKIIDHKVYVDGGALDNTRHFSKYRQVFDEMLIFAAWLYQLPDMDIMINTLDRPWPVPEHPVLSWSFEDIIGDGYSIPHHVHWDKFGLSTGQLEHYMKCLDVKYVWHSKRPKVIWRGSPTGGVRGWDLPTWDPAFKTEQEAWRQLNYSRRVMHNKRAFVSLLSHNYPFMDVGLLKDSWPVFVKSFGSREESLESQTFAKLLTRQRLPSEHWNKYAGQLSMDGHGFVDRIPGQLLSNTALLMLETHQKEWYMDSFQEGVHFMKFSSDASDVIMKGQELVDLYLAGDGRLQEMVAQMRAVALERFNVLAVMDAFAWSLVEASKWCKWKPVLAPEFRPLYLVKDQFFNPYIPADIWDRVVAETHGREPS